MGSNIRSFHLPRVAFLIVLCIVLCCFSSGSFSTGFSAPPDWEYTFCLLPVEADGLPEGAKIVLYLDYPVRIFSARNLNSGLESDGFTIEKLSPVSFQHPRDDDEHILLAFPILISFLKHPVPLCVLVNGVKESNEHPVTTFSKSGVYLKKSAILVRGEEIKFSEEMPDQQSNNIHDTVTTPGLSILSILNHAETTKIITLNFMLSSMENRLLSRLTYSASSSRDAPDAEPDADFDNLTEPQKTLLAALNARFNNGRPLQGINSRLFQHLSMADGVPDIVLQALMSLSGRNDAFREIASNRDCISVDPAILAFLTDWYQSFSTFIPPQKENDDASGNQNVAANDDPLSAQDITYNDLQYLVGNNHDFIADHLEEISAKMILTVALSHIQEQVYGDIKPSHFLIIKNEKIAVILDSPENNPGWRISNAENGFVTIETSAPALLQPWYEAQMKDFRMLAVCLVYAATGMLMGQGSHDSENGEHYFSGEEASFDPETATSLASGNLGSPRQNIKASLNRLSMKKCGKMILGFMPYHLFNFIAELIEASIETKYFISDKLYSLLEKFPGLSRFESTLKQCDYDESSSEELEYLNKICGNTMTVYSVIADGNCLPRAVAAALNAESTQTILLTQEDIRGLLVQRFRNIVDLIRSAPAIRNFFDVIDDDSVSERQQKLHENLASLMSLGGPEALDNIQDDGSNIAEAFGSNWLEPGLLVFLPFEGATVNIHSPIGPNEPLYLSRYDRETWARIAPDLINYLEQNGQLIPDPHSSIHLVHNGQTNQGGHYYYATQNIPETDASGAAITSDQLPTEPEQLKNLPGGLDFFQIESEK